jgi:adhesin/invasin
MITRRSRRLGALVLLGAVWSAACQKVPLLAPSGSTIVLTASNNAIAANGTVALIAQVLEPSGTPPHPGTHVTFTTTLGVIEPADATTDINGQARVTFRANGSNGTATITASSGGATTGSTGAVKIAVGTAATGRITLTANPTTISANGGSATVTANVVDLNGNALVGVPVSFATSAGVLSGSLINTDGTGNALTTLTTSVEATVTATVGAGATSGTGTGTGNGNGTGTGTGSGSTSGQTTATVTVRVNPLPTVSITTQGTTFQAGTPIIFTISAQPGTNSTAQIREVVVNFDDGTVRNLGAVSGTSLTVQHQYDEGDTYTVTVRVTDTLGTVVSAATVIVVQAQAPLNVSIAKTTQPSGGNTNYTLTATVTPPSIVVANYRWTRDGGILLQNGGSNQLLLTFPTGEQHVVSVEVTTTTGIQQTSAVFLP